jgi:hypothetical protein
MGRFARSMHPFALKTLEVNFSCLIKAALSEGKLNNTNLGDVMNTWTRQMGHPVVTVNQTSADTFTLTQKHFLLNPISKPSEVSEYKQVA